MGFNPSTDNFLNSLLRLAFQTAALPFVFTAITAIIYCATFRIQYWWNVSFPRVKALNHADLGLTALQPDSRSVCPMWSSSISSSSSAAVCLPSLYVYSFIFCLRSQARQRQKMQTQQSKPVAPTASDWTCPSDWGSVMPPSACDDTTQKGIVSFLWSGTAFILDILIRCGRVGHRRLQILRRNVYLNSSSLATECKYRL